MARPRCQQAPPTSRNRNDCKPAPRQGYQQHGADIEEVPNNPSSRRRKGKKVPKREQMMGEDGLSSLQTHLQEVAQPVQAHGQGQRMGERPTPPTTVQAKISTPRSCRSPRQKLERERHPEQAKQEDEATREIEIKTEPKHIN